MGKVTIRAELCCGCKLCELACALFRYRTTNPNSSAIRVHCNLPTPQFKVLVDERCDGCLECIELCPTGALNASGEKRSKCPGVAV